MAGGNEPQRLGEEEARQLQEYRAAFEQSRDAIMFQDQERFRHCNPATLAMFRVPGLATFATLHPGDLSPPTQPDGRPSAEAAAARIEEAFDQGQAFFEWRSRTWDGFEFPSEVLLSRIEREEGAILQALVRDISRRKGAEEALRKREKEIAEAQHIAWLGSWVADFRANEIRWSDEVYSIFGMNREEWEGSLEAFMAAVHADDRQAVQAAIDATLEGEPYDVIHRVVRPDGEVRIVRERGFAEFDEDGEAVRMVGTVQDITEQRRLEDRLHRLAAILDSTPDVVGMQGPGGSGGPTLYLNAAARHYLGLPERSGSDPWELGLDEDRAELPPEMDSLEGTMGRAHPSWAWDKLQNEALPTAREEGVWQGETAILDGQGDEIPVSQVVIAHRDEAGEISQYSTIMRDISKRRALEDRLRRERVLSESILEGLPGVFIMIDAEGRLVRWNQQLERVSGLAGEELSGLSILELFPEEDRPRLSGNIGEVLAEGRSSSEASMATVNGLTPYYLHGSVVDLGGASYVLGVGLDISERRALEDQLRQEKTLSESVLSGLPGIFYMTDEEGRLVRWNDRMEAVTGLSPQEMDGIDGLSLVPAEEQGRIAEAIAETFSEGSTLVESKLCTVEGETPYLLNGLRVDLDGQPYLLGIGLDISKQKQLEVALEREATTDRLTGVANRQRFDAEMGRALGRFQRYGTDIALMMIDLDGFKAVNDTFGHDVGDRVLVEVAERVAGVIRDPDFLARWGGEEFTILLPETAPSEACQMAERLRHRIEAEKFAGVGRLTMSVGVTGFRSGDTANSVLKRVDDALYEAKRSGRNRVVVDGAGSAI